MLQTITGPHPVMSDHNRQALNYMNTYFAPVISLLLCLMLPTIGYSVDEASPQTQIADALSPAEMIIGKLWRQSNEEEKQESKVRIFRTDDSKVFPPSRFRMAYKFMKDGQCEWYYLSPDDNHRFKQGKWSIDAKDKSIITITTDNGAMVYKIITATNCLMELMESKQ